MIRLFPVAALLWFAAAATDAAPASSAAGTEEWSGAARQPCNSALHRSRPQLRAGFVLGAPAVLPAPIVLCRPPLTATLLVDDSASLPPCSRPGSLGARAPPV